MGELEAVLTRVLLFFFISNSLLLVYTVTLHLFELAIVPSQAIYMVYRTPRVQIGDSCTDWRFQIHSYELLFCMNKINRTILSELSGYQENRPNQRNWWCILHLCASARCCSKRTNNFQRRQCTKQKIPGQKNISWKSKSSSRPPH